MDELALGDVVVIDGRRWTVVEDPDPAAAWPGVHALSDGRGREGLLHRGSSGIWTAWTSWWATVRPLEQLAPGAFTSAHQ